MSNLLDTAAEASGIPRERLSFAKPPSAGPKALTPALIASLKWDDPKVLSCAKVGSYPLQLRDGDQILLRDGRNAPGGTELAGAAVAAGGGAGGRGRGRGKRGGGRAMDTVVVAGGRGARREEGLSIQTCFDAPPSASS